MRIYLLIALLISVVSWGQKADTVHLKDGDKIIVDIQEVDGNFIKYKKMNAPDGPTYTLTAEDISFIKLSSGDRINNYKGQLSSNEKNVKIKSEEPKPINNSNNDPFYDEKKDAKKNERVTKSKLYNTRKNMVGFNYSSFITLDLEFSYERIVDKVGYFGIKIPIKFNMGITPSYLNKHNIFTSGIHCNIYPLGQGRVSYFTGPAFHIKVMADNDNVTTSGNNSISITVDPTRSTYLGFYMNNGCLFRASPFLYFGVGVGFGFRKDLARPTENSIFDVIGEASIRFRF